VKLVLGVALVVSAPVVFANCSCSAPDVPCSITGDNACCGCGTLQSQCLSCESGCECIVCSARQGEGTVGTARGKKVE
jgi:hypothetical protein